MQRANDPVVQHAAATGGYTNAAYGNPATQTPGNFPSTATGTGIGGDPLVGKTQGSGTSEPVTTGSGASGMGGQQRPGGLVFHDSVDRMERCDGWNEQRQRELAQQGQQQDTAGTGRSHGELLDDPIIAHAARTGYGAAYGDPATQTPGNFPANATGTGIRGDALVGKAAAASVAGPDGRVIGVSSGTEGAPLNFDPESATTAGPASKTGMGSGVKGSYDKYPDNVGEPGTEASHIGGAGTGAGSHKPSIIDKVKGLIPGTKAHKAKEEATSGVGRLNLNEQ